MCGSTKRLGTWNTYVRTVRSSFYPRYHLQGKVIRHAQIFPRQLQRRLWINDHSRATMLSTNTPIVASLAAVFWGQCCIFALYCTNNQMMQCPLHGHGPFLHNLFRWTLFRFLIELQVLMAYFLAVYAHINSNMQLQHTIPWTTRTSNCIVVQLQVFEQEDGEKYQKVVVN